MHLLFSVLFGLAVFRIRVIYFRYGDLGKEATSCLVLSLGKKGTPQLEMY